MSATEINDLHLLNGDGRMKHLDEWNTEIYNAMKKPYCKENSSRDFVESIRYSEYNDFRTAVREDEKKEEDDNSGGSQTSLVNTFVALCVGAVMIANSYMTVKTGQGLSSLFQDSNAASVPAVTWEWSEDHESASVVLGSSSDETSIPADIRISEKVYCTTEGVRSFHAKATDEQGRGYYDVVNETVPPKGHDYVVDSTGIDETTGKVYADYVCQTCGEHFVMDAEIKVSYSAE